MTIAIVGATGAVGQATMQVLEKRKFPIKNIRCFASSASSGKILTFNGTPIRVEMLTPASFAHVDIAFFSAGKQISSDFVPYAVRHNCFVVDNSSAFRMDPKVPLVIPEINAHMLELHQGIVASPNCTATMMLMAITPLHRHIPIKRIVMSTYQAASGAGQKAMDELKKETQAILNHEPFHPSIMPYQYAFNLFSHNSPMTESGYNEEELKVIEESQKILENSNLKISVNCIRVPVLRAHAEALNVEFTSHLSVSDALDLLKQAPGLRILENWEQNRFPMPLDASDQDAVFVGKIRQDLSQPHTLDLWVVGDQLLKGAALNAVQIAETALKLNLCSYNISPALN